MNHLCHPSRLLCAAGALTMLASPAFAQDRTAARPQPARGDVVGDMLGTMSHGYYECALPGNASSAAFIAQPAESFRLGAGSSYDSDAGSGVYLMHGPTLVFTRGPKKDERFRRLGANTLQRIASDGSPDKLICTRLGGAD